MADVGAAAGVTDRTVSNVLSGKVAVRPATRDAVMRAVQDLGYQMNVSARSLRTGQLGFITLALPYLTQDYYAELADAVLSEADSLGWSVTLHQTSGKRERELALLAGGERPFGDGLIFLPHALNPGDREALRTDVPVVLLGERISTAPVDHITMDNIAAARAATAHLLRSGRRRIVAVGGDPTETSTTANALRLEGYRQALAAAGIPASPQRIVAATVWDQAQGVRLVNMLIDDGVDFDGLFCFNDSLAIGALRALTEHAVSVPDQVAVIGFDNVSAAAYTNPPLSSVDTEIALLAQMAVQRLIGRIEQTLIEPPRTFLTTFRIVQRATI